MLKEVLEIRAAVLEATTLEDEKLFRNSGRVNRSLIAFAKTEILRSDLPKTLCFCFSSVEVNVLNKAHIAALSQAAIEIMDGVK